MALPDTIPYQVGTLIILGDATDHSPSANNDFGDETDQIDLTDLADTAARQSDKIDWGADRAQSYHAYAAFEFAATPVAGEVVQVFNAPSPIVTAAVGNPGGVTGVDGAYTGTAASTLAESVEQLDFIGTFIVTDDLTGTVQIGDIGIFTPSSRFGSIVVKNESGAAFHSDMVETSIVFEPIVTAVVD